MARITLTPVQAVRNSKVDVTTKYVTIGTSVVATGLICEYEKNDHLVLHVKNTVTAEKDITIKASTQDCAYMQGQGDLVIAVPASSEVMIMGLEQPRFCYIDDGKPYLYIDFETGFEGSILALDTIY